MVCPLATDLAGTDVDPVEVTDHGNQAVSMIDEHGFAIEEYSPVSRMTPRALDNTGVPRGTAISIPLCGDRASPLKIRRKTKGTGHATLCRRSKIACRIPINRPVPFEVMDPGYLHFCARGIFWRKMDLPRVFQRDALFRVGFPAGVEINMLFLCAVLDSQTMAPLRKVDCQSEDGDPLRAVSSDPDWQVAEPGAGCGAPSPETGPAGSRAIPPATRASRGRAEQCGDMRARKPAQQRGGELHVVLHALPAPVSGSASLSPDGERLLPCAAVRWRACTCSRR